MSWVIWAFAGLLPWFGFFAWAWSARGVSPHRLIWPVFPELKSAREAEERLLAPRLAANKMFYGPLLVAGFVVGAAVISELGSIGLALVSFGVVPPLLSAVATLRAYLAVRRLRRSL